ncbi:MAG: DUF2207 domain-containing protein [Xanthomonadales bacterium]|nr:DUF2207 domain-containing protein [Xanthomonadales bacterium]
MRWLKTALLLLFCSLSIVTQATERIKHFHSEIEVKTSGDVFVTETIKVLVEHENIRRGIYRDFPTLYRTALLTKSTVDFEVFEVLRNGKTEPYHTENLSNGIRVYIGDRNLMVERGEQSYQISYRTNRQIAFMDAHDRFAWNVTGNDWRFAMDQVSAEVKLPDGVSMAMVNSEVWTGFAGETSADYSSEINGNVMEIHSTKMLEPYQGMTFSLEIPKGYIVNDSNWLLDFFGDNLLWVLMVVTLLSLLMFYILAWHQVGRDPDPGVIVPLFYPPNDISPAAMRFILEEKADHKNFTAALINLAVKGYIKLKKYSKGYELAKQPATGKETQPMSSGEQIIMKRLLNHRNSVMIDKKYDSKVKTAMKMVNSKIKSEYKDKCFKDNRMLGYFGMGISVLVLFFLMLHLNFFDAKTVANMVVPLFITGFTLGAIFRSKRGLMNSLMVMIHGLVMVVIFVAQSIGGFPKEVVIMSIFLVLVNGVFIYLLKSPTPFGRELMDKIEGFKLYLSTAEQHRLDIMHPPEMSPELFEKYLPYAMALGVENQWSQRFADYLQSAGTDTRSSGYQPDWYSGGNFNLSSSSNGFSGISSAMSSTIASASVPPSSSSSGGGGFSGGGGGGGGGGGW